MDFPFAADGRFAGRISTSDIFDGQRLWAVDVELAGMRNRTSDARQPEEAINAPEFLRSLRRGGAGRKQMGAWSAGSFGNDDALDYLRWHRIRWIRPQPW